MNENNVQFHKRDIKKLPFTKNLGYFQSTVNQLEKYEKFPNTSEPYNKYQKQVPKILINFRDINFNNNVRNYKTLRDFKKHFNFKNISKTTTSMISDLIPPSKLAPANQDFARFLDLNNIAFKHEEQGLKLKEEIKYNLNYLIDSLNKNNFMSDSIIFSEREKVTNTIDYAHNERKLNKDYYKQRVEYINKTLWKENNIFKVNPANFNNETHRTNKNTETNSRSNLKLPHINNLKTNINTGEYTNRSDKEKLCSILDKIDKKIKLSSEKNLNDVKLNFQTENNNFSNNSSIDWNKYDRVRQYRNIYQQN